MLNQTNLGMSLGKILAGAFGGNSEAELKGKVDGAHALYYQSGADFNRAKTAESEADTSLKNRQLNLDPDEIAAGQLGIGGDLAGMLKKFSKTGDYGNGSMDVPNNLPTGERNLANSYRTGYIKPEAWDDDLAKRYGQARSAINYALTMGEKNPENYVKAINETNKGDFQRGVSSQDVVDRAYRDAAVQGKPLDVQKAGYLEQIAAGGLDPQKFNSLVQTLTLGNGDSMYNFGQDYVGNNVTGEQTLNQIGTGEVGLKKAQTANQRSNMEVDQARIRNLDAKTASGFDENGNPVPKVTPTQQSSNAEIDLARKRMAGMSMDEVRAKTQQYLPNGRENPSYDPTIAQAYRTANNRKVGADPTFDAFAAKAQPINNPVQKPKAIANPESRFKAEPAMRNYTLGAKTTKGYEVKDASGKLVGYWE